jgi:Flp pilus assembly protein TadG
MGGFWLIEHNALVGSVIYFCCKRIKSIKRGKMMRNLFLIAVLMLSANAGADSLEDIKTTQSQTAPAPAETAPPKELTLVEKVGKFEKGKTTYNDVVRELGQPAKTEDRDDGSKAVVYGGIVTSSNAASYIPIANMFAGKTTTTGTQVSLLFDKSNILVRKFVFQP